MKQSKSFIPRLWIYALIACGVVVADQVTKWLAVEALTTAFTGDGTTEIAWGEKLQRFLTVQHPRREGAVTVLTDFWHFRYVENPGAAWGFLSGSGSALRTPFFLLVSVFAMGFIVAYFRRTLPEQRFLRCALALVLGGAIGNFLDRVRLGYVIDFIDWHWYDKATWPTFNIADSAITIGVLILLLEMFLQKPEQTTQVANPERRAS